MKKLIVLLGLVLLFTFPFMLAHAQMLSPSTVPWQKTQIIASSSTQPASSEPSVLYENGLWRMWYRVGWGNNLQGIFYATSSDAIHWTKYGHVTNDYNAHVYRYNSTTLLMYAHGLVTQHSADGIHWYNFTQQYGLLPNPWLNQADPYPHEIGGIGNSEVLELPNGTYLMYYDALDCVTQGASQACQLADWYWGVNGASSNDGINNWMRSSSNPLLGGVEQAYSAANPNVVYQNGVYYAFVDYYVPDPWYIVETLATSTDRTNFTFNYGPTNPVLSIDVEKKVDPYCNQVGDAWAMSRPEGIYLFYDEDANLAANVSHASIWLAFLPNTTLEQLASGQFGANTSSVSEGLTPITLGISLLGSAFMIYHVRRKK